ncbi:MAG: ComEC/Rec2 family competence protein [Candidatus Zixiibacteriota bacterium]|nr:MAG: ComEC/Rec2 family competence protein [candidate division Zixibacteria bacterium]
MARRYPAIFALGAVVFGIVAADSCNLASWLWFFLSLVTALGMLIVRGKAGIGPVGLLCLLSLAMASAFGYSFRYKTSPPGHIAHYVDDDQTYTLFGTIDSWPILKDHRTEVYLQVDSLCNGKLTRPAQGRMLLHIQTETTRLQYGDRIFFTTRLYSIRGGKNPSGFDYRRYLNLKGIVALAYQPHPNAIQIDPASRGHFRHLIDRLRSAIVSTFRNTLDPDAAALASGFLIGETKDIPPHVYDHFRDTGTLHLLAVSGSNVALVVMVFAFLLKASRVKPLGRTLLLLGVIFIFSFLAYNQPSVVRAAVMASLVLLGKVFQRRIDLNNVIASAALVILLYRPTELFDVGFQLSFTTAWALIFLVPIAGKVFRLVSRRFYYRFVIFPLLVCIIAQLASLPMSAYYFQRMPLISFVSNLVIVPLVGITVIGEIVVLLVSLILPVVGQFIGAWLNPVLKLIISLLEFFGSGRMTMLLTCRVTTAALIVYYVLLGLGFLSIISIRARRALVIAVLLAANLFVIESLRSDRFQLLATVFSIPRGYIAISQEEQTRLILCRLPLRDYLLSEKIIEPYLNNTGISPDNIIILTSEYQTVREAVHLLGRYPVAAAYLPGSVRHLFSDICLAGGIYPDTNRVIFIEESRADDNRWPGDLLLEPGRMSYLLDSSAIIFGSGSMLDLITLPPRGYEDLAVVLPELTEHDLHHLGKSSATRSRLVVCHRLTKKARWELGMAESDRADFIEIRETSQFGAVQIVASDGRLMLR